MARGKNPVEQRVELLRDLWMQALEAPGARLLVWRIPANADRLLSAFVEIQQYPGDWSVPDFMLRMDADFETGYAYSRALRQALREGYFESESDLLAQGVAGGWTGAVVEHSDSAAGVAACFGDFAAHHSDRLRYFAPLLMPATVTDTAAFEAWLEAALQAPIPEQVRLVLVDHCETRQWQALADRHRGLIRVIDAPIDLFDVAREIAAQSSGGAAGVAAYRQALTDVLTLTEKGSAEQTARRAERALALAERKQWADQQVVVHLIVGGAFLKEQRHSEAIARYRLARDCAGRAEAAGNPVGANLLMQCWFSEAGAWLAAREPEQAARAYVEGARAAQRVPNAFFGIEGYRMAGFCLAQGGHAASARDVLLRTVAEARPMAAAERRLTTFPLALQELLRLQDARRAAGLEACADDYRQAAAQAQRRAEKRAARLGPRPAPAALEEIEQERVEALEKAFSALCRTRERLIEGGDEFFRKVVAVGREYLDPAWNGLPEVRHPLDKEIPEWSEPPAFALLPDPADLAAGAVHGIAVEGATASEEVA